jgi:hypothetical protein
MVTNLAWNSFFIHNTFHYSFSTKICGPTNHLKMVLAFSKVALVASTTPSLEIPRFSCISTWSMKISWPHTRPRILLSSVASQVCKKPHNKYSFGVVHCMLNRLSKLAHLAHFNLLESIFIHYNILLSFALDIGLFWIGFLTRFSTCALPFRFIMVFVSDLGH